MGLFRRILFGNRDDYQQTLDKYTDALLNTKPDLKHLCSMLPYLLVKTMKLSHASIAVLDPAANSYQIYSADREAEARSLSPNFVLIQELIKTKSRLLLPEIKNFGLQAAVKSLDAVLIIPAFDTNHTLVLTINLGERGLGKVFSSEDIRYLRGFADRIVKGLASIRTI